MASILSFKGSHIVNGGGCSPSAHNVAVFIKNGIFKKLWAVEIGILNV